MAEPETPETNAKAASGGGKKRFLITVIGAVAVIAVAVVVGVVGFPDAAQTHVEKPKEMQSTLIGLPQVVVNVAASKGLHLLQVTATVEVTASDATLAQSEFSRSLPRVQDLLIRQLSMLTSEEIDGASNKDFIKTRIKDELNAQLFANVEYKVSNVFFTEFVLQ